jgi:hypothetical protein
MFARHNCPVHKAFRVAITKSDTAGEVIFVENYPADKPALRGFTAPPSYSYPTLPAVFMTGGHHHP